MRRNPAVEGAGALSRRARLRAAARGSYESLPVTTSQALAAIGRGGWRGTGKRARMGVLGGAASLAGGEC